MWYSMNWWLLQRALSTQSASLKNNKLNSSSSSSSSPPPLPILLLLLLLLLKLILTHAIFVFIRAKLTDSILLLCYVVSTGKLLPAFRGAFCIPRTVLWTKHRHKILLLSRPKNTQHIYIYIYIYIYKIHIVNMGQLLALFYVIKIFIYIK